MLTSQAGLERILHVLSAVDRPGDFYATGMVESPTPHIEVEGVGTLSFPIPAAQGRELVGVAELAPYGRGGETLVDSSVRRVWQAGAGRIRVGPRWAKTVAAIQRAAASGLGVEGKVHAELYKLLVYDKGSFFVEHRDTEKASGMFATLVVALPSAHEGGDLVVRHGDRTVTLPLGRPDPAEIPWAAFFADCVHEVRPVTAGFRVCLVYNLVRVGAAALAAPNHEGAVDHIAEVLREWSSARDSWPTKVALALTHHYTPAGLSFGGLKNADRGVAAVVVEAARRASCTVHLAMVAITENGTAEENHDWGSRRRRSYDDDHFEVLDVLHREVAVEGWIGPGDRRVALGLVAVEPGEVWPADAISEEKPDEQHYHEATGNEGAEYERTYRRAALVLWPAEGLVDVLAQAPPRSAVPALERLMVEDRAAALALVRGVVDRWEERENPSWRSARPRTGRSCGHSCSTPLDGSVRAAELRHFLERVVVPVWGRNRRGQRSDELAAALARLDPEGAASVVGALFREWAATCPDDCAGLLALLVEGGTNEVAVAAAEALVGSLPGAPSAVDARRPWWRSSVTPVFVTSLFRSLWRLRLEDLAERAARRASAWYPVDGVLLPAALSLAPATGQPGWEALRMACVGVLEPRAAVQITAPVDLARSAQWKCTCGDCPSFHAFLASPTERSWTFKAAEARRRHLEAVVGEHKIDVDCATHKTTNPRTLVCTKNTRSFERLVARRAADLAALDELGHPPARGRQATGG